MNKVMTSFWWCDGVVMVKQLCQSHLQPAALLACVPLQYTVQYSIPYKPLLHSAPPVRAE